MPWVLELPPGRKAGSARDSLAQFSKLHSKVFMPPHQFSAMSLGSCATMSSRLRENKGRHNQMIRKAALQIAALALLVFMAVNAYSALSHLRLIQKSTALILESSATQANIAGVSQDLSDMETGQRGYLLTGDESYLQPYTDAKSRIESRFAGLRSVLRDRPEQERSLETQLEALASSKEDEMQRTITFRQKGYRHRAFVLVNTNEGKGYMDRARALITSLASLESENLTRFQQDKAVASREAISKTVMASALLLGLTALLFILIAFYVRSLERRTAQSNSTLATRDSELEKLVSALSTRAPAEIKIIEENARLLLGKFGGFLPKQGYEYAEQIEEAARELETLRRELLNSPASAIDRKAA